MAAPIRGHSGTIRAFDCFSVVPLLKNAVYARLSVASLRSELRLPTVAFRKAIKEEKKPALDHIPADTLDVCARLTTNSQENIGMPDGTSMLPCQLSVNNSYSFGEAGPWRRSTQIYGRAAINVGKNLSARSRYILRVSNIPGNAQNLANIIGDDDQEFEPNPHTRGNEQDPSEENGDDDPELGSFLPAPSSS
ncbi:hypothetical protein JOM56_007121 [Amanita muscaria]